ncbi:uncharacterized protein V1518DRAFT_376065 [Limtongia smithiae]|uniref:uncharacterized protein n=1 Tax=Limtongia smithiae TaxID=1125753 RepID=UPI0034D01111
MSLCLFKYYYQDDLEQFKLALEGAVGGNVHLVPHSQKRGGGGYAQQTPALTIKDINRADEYGRTVLHLACTHNKVEFVRLLLAAPGIDVTTADAESGWTPLHRALYNGNVAVGQLLISFRKETIRAKDREGNSPFDVLNSTIDGTNPGSLDVAVGGSELYTFGSNANHTLGFIDGDDRANPERVYFERPLEYQNEAAIKKFQGVHIRDVQMSKLHTVVLTSDARNNLYVCGFGNSGRLGLNSSNTQFVLKNLPRFGDIQITQIAVSQDHTLAVAANGECYSWGSNKCGQLGYSIEVKKSQDEPIQPIPRKIVAGLKKERIIGVAASRLHSVAFSDTELFTWGKNVGQLGYEGHNIEYTPRKVSSLTCPVKSVAAIDNATICLLENNDVIVYINNGYFKVFFPLERFADKFSVFRPRALYSKNTIVKIVAGGHTVLALSSLGDVFSFQLDGKGIDNAKPGSLSKLVKPQNVWSLKRKHLAVRDLDVGQDGSVIICTEAGSVWQKVRRPKNKDSHGNISEFKFSRIPYLTRAVSVRSNKFGAYAAIRSDSTLPQIDVSEGNLSDDIEGYISFVDYTSDIDNDDGTDSVVSEGDERTAASRLPSTYISTLKLLQDEELPELLQERLHDLELEGGRGYDIWLTSHENENILIPAHKIIIASRSAVLMSLISDSRSLVEGITVSTNGDKMVLMFENTGLLAVLSFIYFAYMDYLLPIWDGVQRGSRHGKKLLAAKQELITLSGVLQMKSLTLAVYLLQRPVVTLPTDILNAVQDPRAQAWSDLTIKLEDCDVRCYAVILAARSEFFETLTAARWTAIPQSNFTINDAATSSQDRTVDMKHVRYDVFKIILQFMYGQDDCFSLFADVQAESLSEFLEFVLEVLSVANELLLDRLTQKCQELLRTYVDMRNAASLLMEADFYSADGLKKSMLDYMSLNIECMLENGLLNALSESLLDDLEAMIRVKQQEKLPISKSGVMLELLEARNPSLTEARRREKDRIVQNFSSSSLPSSYGSLPRSFMGSSSLGFSFDRATPEGAPGKSGHNHHNRRKRRESREAAVNASPIMRPTSSGPGGSDFIFDMEDELEIDWQVVKGKHVKAAAVGAPALSSSPAPNADAIAGRSLSSSFKDGAYPWMVSSPASNFSASPATITSSPFLGKPEGATPWATMSASKAAPIDFKSLISEQVKPSSSHVSGISLGLRQRSWNELAGSSTPTKSTVSTATTAAAAAAAPTQTLNFDELSKVPQKERKKRHQESTAAAALMSSTARSSSSPWQTTTKDARPKSSIAKLPAAGDGASADSFHALQSALFAYPNGPHTSFASTAAKNISGPPGVVRRSSSTAVTPVVLASGNSSVNHSGKSSPAPGASASTTAPSFSRSSPAVRDSPSPSSSTPRTTPRHQSQLQQSAHSDSASVLQLSLADIIEQQRIEQEIAVTRSQPKKSFKELAAEEEFALWWAAESDRVQKEAKRQEELAKKTAIADERHESKRGGRGSSGGRRGGAGAGGRGGFQHRGKGNGSSVGVDMGTPRSPVSTAAQEHTPSMRK